jgi:hypothetical protein
MTSTFRPLFGLDDDAPESGDDVDEDVTDAAGERPTVGVADDPKDASQPMPMALSLFSLSRCAKSSSPDLSRASSLKAKMDR